MASVFRHILRNIRRNGSKRASLGGAPAVGTHRAGMHQASEHAYQRSRMAADAPEPETVEEALEMPAELESEIPPAEEEDDAEVEAIAEETAVVEADEEILGDVADPEGSIEEETLTSFSPSGTAETWSRRRMAADYSGERIPEMMPPVSDPASADTPLMYSPGDGALKEIQEPLPGMGEKYGIAPVINGILDPSANVAAYEEPEPEPEPDPDPEPVDPETPDVPAEPEG